MSRTVFDNRQCAHVWAQQNQPSGRGAKGSIYFEGRTIYSYGSHFPMATFLSHAVVLINSDSYSVSTSRHQGYVSSAVYHKTRLYACTRVLKVAADWHDNENARDAAIGVMLKRVTLKEVEQHLCAALTKRMKKSKAAEIDAAINTIHRTGDIYSALGLQMPKELLARLDMLTAENSDILESFKAQKEKEAKTAERKRKAQEKKDAVILINAVAKWQARKPLDENESPVFRRAEKLYMRVNEDEIETSQGARFPVTHAKKAFLAIRRAKENGTYYVRNSINTHQKTFRLGAFTIDRIDVNGDVKAGCHLVQWDEIERVARILKIYP